MKKIDEKIQKFLYGKKHSVMFYRIAQRIEDTFFNSNNDYSGHGGDIAPRNNAFHHCSHDYGGKDHVFKMLLLAPCLMLLILVFCIFL
ncbi:MAG: hypothetical protein K6E98_08540, partial [Lachnospiraceae bacterium]|nr:hypothetical protein [Lachnospiraceae bacterium]